MRISDWSSDVCSSDLKHEGVPSLKIRCAQRHRLPGGLGAGRAASLGCGQRLVFHSSRDRGQEAWRSRSASTWCRAVTSSITNCTKSASRSVTEASPVGSDAGSPGPTGRAHVSTPVTNAHHVCRSSLDTKKTNYIY